MSDAEDYINSNTYDDEFYCPHGRIVCDECAEEERSRFEDEE